MDFFVADIDGLYVSGFGAEQAESTFAGSPNLKTIGMWAFGECSSLTSVELPRSVTSIGINAFRDCTELYSVVINNSADIGITAFCNLKSGATVEVHLTAGEGATGEFWATFYNNLYGNGFQADASTKIFKASLSGSSLTLTELTTDKIVTWNNAVILKSNASPIVLTLTETASSNDFSGNSLSGVSSASGLTANGTHFVLNKGSQGVGFYRMKSGKTIGVGKAYLTYSGALAREFFAFEEETTDISTTDYTDYMDKAGAWYTIDGRRLQGKPNTKGLYILNGKKTVIK